MANVKFSNIAGRLGISLPRYVFNYFYRSLQTIIKYNIGDTLIATCISKISEPGHFVYKVKIKSSLIFFLHATYYFLVYSLDLRQKLSQSLSFFICFFNSFYLSHYLYVLPFTDCMYNGRSYTVGTKFRSPDGCRVCQCLTDGTVSCSETLCWESNMARILIKTFSI